MAPLTDDRPKPMVEVAGKPLLDHALDLVADSDPIVINTHYKPETLLRHIQGRDFQVSHEDSLLETGGGLRNALPLLGDGPIITLNTDAVWKGPNVLDQLRAAWDPERMDALLALVPKDRANGHTGAGDFLLESDGRISYGPGLIYTGAQIVKPDRLSDITKDFFSLRELWDLLAAEGALFGMVYSGQWCDVGQPESIAIAEDMLGV